MKTRHLHRSAIVAAVALMLGSLSFAQSPSLTLPNNSAGTADGMPGMPATTVINQLPTSTESSLTAFDKLDPQHRGYVTRSETDRLPNRLKFDEADRNRDGRLDIDEFQRAWADQGQGGQ